MVRRPTGHKWQGFHPGVQLYESAQIVQLYGSAQTGVQLYESALDESAQILSPSVPNRRYEPLTLNVLQFIKSLKHDSTKILCLCLKEKQTCQIISS